MKEYEVRALRIECAKAAKALPLLDDERAVLLDLAHDLLGCEQGASDVLDTVECARQALAGDYSWRLI